MSISIIYERQKQLGKDISFLGHTSKREREMKEEILSFVLKKRTLINVLSFQSIRLKTK